MKREFQAAVSFKENTTGRCAGELPSSCEKPPSPGSWRACSCRLPNKMPLKLLEPPCHGPASPVRPHTHTHTPPAPLQSQPAPVSPNIRTDPLIHVGLSRNITHPFSIPVPDVKNTATNKMYPPLPPPAPSLAPPSSTSSAAPAGTHLQKVGMKLSWWPGME